MQWFTKYFSANDISSGYDKKMEELLLNIIFGEGGHTIFFEDDTYRRRARFAAYRSDPDADGAFTSYFTEAVRERFPHLETNYVFKSCPKPDPSSVRTWIGIEPLASQILKKG